MERGILHVLVTLRYLVATDAAREGINLQAHCYNLFHFDVPWNPSRLEQRNGRIAISTGSPWVSHPAIRVTWRPCIVRNRHTRSLMVREMM
ncbi:MAG: helicase-related protein [Gemmatimonadota bacterium]